MFDRFFWWVLVALGAAAAIAAVLGAAWGLL